MNESAVQLKRARSRPISLRKKLLLIVPLPIGGYFLVRALALTSTSGGDAISDLANGLLRGIFFLGALASLYLSARAFFAIIRPRD